jgi:hypothetical protein
MKAYRDVVVRFRELRRQFEVVHKDAMDALERGDYSALGEAIRREGEILKQQRALFDSTMPSKNADLAS